MSNETRVEALLDQWMELREKNHEPTPEELCADSPDLLPALHERIERHKAFERRFAAPTNDRSEAATVSAPAHPTSECTVPVIPGYDIQTELGRGGMGIVYLAHDPELHRELAIKVLHSDYLRDAVIRDRFLIEAHVTARLQHPNVPPVHKRGQLIDGRPYFAMKLIRGRTLDLLLAERPSADHDLSRWLQVFAQACQAVGYAHTRKVLHRDLKPHNVMVGEFGEVQVMDWGLAKELRDATPIANDPSGDNESTNSAEVLCTPPMGASNQVTQPGSVLGTLRYLPPEQARGLVDSLDERCDVFSLGAILCEILTGGPPYLGGDGLEVLAKARKADLADAWARLGSCGADPELVALTKECLSENREARPKNGGEVATRVTMYQARVQDRLRQAELDYVRAEGDRAKAEAMATEQRKRRKVQLALAIAMALLIVSAIGLAWGYQRSASRKAAALAEERAKTAREVDAALQTALTINNLGVKEAAATLDLEQWAVTSRQANAAFQNAVSLMDAGKSTEDLRAKVEDVRQQLTEAEADRKLGVGVEDCMGDILEGSHIERYRDAADKLEKLLVARGLALSGPDRENTIAWARTHPLKDLIQALLTFTGIWKSLSGGNQDFVELSEKIDSTRHADYTMWAYAFALKQKKILTTLCADPEIVKRFPPTALALVGRSLRTHGEPEIAKARLKEWQAIHPDSFWLNIQLAMALRVDNTPDSLRFATAAVSLRPKSPRAYVNLASCLATNGELGNAAEACKKALELDPNFALAHDMNGQILFRLDDLKGAEASFSRAAQLDPRLVNATERLKAVRAELAKEEEVKRQAGDIRLRTLWVANEPMKTRFEKQKNGTWKSSDDGGPVRQIWKVTGQSATEIQLESEYPGGTIFGTLSPTEHTYRTKEREKTSIQGRFK